MNLARVAAMMIGLAACRGHTDSATRAPHATSKVPRDGAADTTPLVVIDRPTVIGFFPPAKDSSEAEESGYSEGVAHVGFALDDAAACLGRESTQVAFVVDTAVRLTQRGRPDTLRFSRTDSLSYGAYLLAPGRAPRLIQAMAPSALGHAVVEAIPAYFRRSSCPAQ